MVNLLASLLVKIRGENASAINALKQTREEGEKTNVSLRTMGRGLRQFGFILTAFGVGTLLLLKRAAETTSEALGDPALTDATDRLSDALNTLMEDIGETTIPIMANFVNGLTALVEAFNNLPESMKQVIILFALIVGVFAIFLGAAAIIVGILAQLGGAWIAVKLVIIGVLGAIAAAVGAPIAVVAAVILALIVVVLLLKKAWDENWFGIQQIVANIVKTIGGIISWLVKFFQDAFNKIGQIVSKVLGIVANIVKGVFEWIVNQVINAVNFVIDSFNAIARFIGLPQIGRLQPFSFNQGGDGGTAVYIDVHDNVVENEADLVKRISDAMARDTRLQSNYSRVV